MEGKPLVFCGRASFKLATNVCDLLRMQLSDLDIMGFADGEPWYKVIDGENITGRHVVVIQSTSEYAPKTYFDLWGIMKSIQRFNPGRLTVAMPFMGFRRQERDKEGGEAVMAELMAKFIVLAGATDLILCDPHASILVDYFTESGAAVKVISGNQVFSELMFRRDLINYKVFTPDGGREDEATQLAKILNLEFLIGCKTRFGIDESEANGFIGDARGQKIIIREDEISTGGTMMHSCHDLKKAGAIGAIILATHGVFSVGSVQKLKRMDFIKEIWITDSIYLPWEKRIEKISIRSIAPLLAKTIMEIHES